MDDYARGRSHMRRPDATDPIPARTCGDGAGELATRLELRRPVIPAIRHARPASPHATGPTPGDPTTSEFSFGQRAEGVTVPRHKFTPFVNLLLDFGVVGREQVAFWRFYGEERVIFLHFKANQHFLGQQDARRGSNGTEFEFHDLSIR